MRDVSTLTSLQQRELLVWLDRHTGQMQLVSISSKPLYDQVQDGTFDEQLYYFEILEARGFTVALVNARHVKHVQGRKSDVSDCECHSRSLLTVLSAGLAAAGEPIGELAFQRY